MIYEIKEMTVNGVAIEHNGGNLIIEGARYNLGWRVEWFSNVVLTNGSICEIETTSGEKFKGILTPGPQGIGMTTLFGDGKLEKI